MSVILAELNLSELEGKIRKDPESYSQDVCCFTFVFDFQFVVQYENYIALEATYLSAPSEYVPKLDSLLMFLSQV